ncbi:MAG: transcriptional regulator [Candidatus Bathyarchaeota archaeon]|nr:MAG: transcriptional regulator [Candidatus Bathyarchaeota archaeon]
MSLEETLKRIERKLEKIEAEIMQMRMHLLTGDLAETPTLIDLPDHLRKTAIGLMKIKEGTARDVSQSTKRARAVESGYLNQLERQGFVKSFRRGRNKVFSIGNTQEIKDRLKQA